ncbi:Ger(x)C family spore germination protein [Cohnella nanjingensis]|uniref:Ger(X)C family spore germination protein n=1 Tax=Cohnella nanjingensis TaxID=1387779 RepID=A0A7X0RKW5_9BACL|nr:Ger(x)C family spore germination protein [Cohnella nanjingensis]MBB6669231.1 Ger(x)C family spore germination protein [Cohnella nanjingensis]
MQTMPAKLMKAIGALAASATLASCWDASAIQEINYFTSMGVDYEEKTKIYTVYAALINMADVAKTEGSGSKMPTFVGHGQGRTVHLALNEMYRSSQLAPTLDHLMTVVVTEPTLSHMDEVLDGINRSRAVRYNINLIGTNESPEKILTSARLFESPLYSFLYQPVPKGPGKPLVAPMTLQAFVREYHSETNTTLLPNLRINDRNWIQGDKHPNFLMYDGAFVVEKEKDKGYLTEKELRDIRWVRADASRTFMEVRRGSDVVAVLLVASNKHKLTYAAKGGRPAFTLRVTVDAFVHEMLQEAQDRDLIRLAEQNLKEDLEEAIALGREREMDLFNVEEAVYRWHLKDWKKLRAQQTKFERLPIQVEVKLNLTNTGKLKLLKNRSKWRSGNTMPSGSNGQ